MKEILEILVKKQFGAIHKEIAHVQMVETETLKDGSQYYIPGSHVLTNCFCLPCSISQE